MVFASGLQQNKLEMQGSLAMVQGRCDSCRFTLQITDHVMVLFPRGTIAESGDQSDRRGSSWDMEPSGCHSRLLLPQVVAAAP
jgi:hypothetical protein